MAFSIQWTSRDFVLFSVYFIVSVNVILVRTLPNERQAHELMLLENLGKRGGVSSDQETLMDLVSRSRCFINIIIIIF